MTEKATLRAVLVGCGSMSAAWINAIRTIPDLELVGFADLRLEAARVRAAEYGSDEAVVGTDIRQVLAETRPDMVFDCTVPEAHTAVTLAALEQGCHVLGEKPMADTLDNARRMTAAAQQAGKLYAVIQNRRYEANIRRLKRLLDSGVMGPLTTLNSDFYIGAHFGGFRDEMQHPLLLDMAIHTFDAARFLTGADPVSVYCHEWNPSGSWYRHGASAVAVFEMTGGIVYTYRGSWCAQGLMTTWESDWRIIGERGTAIWRGGEPLRAQVATGDSGFYSTFQDIEVPAEPAGEDVHGHTSIIREFVACVRSGGTPQTICTDNIKSLAMVFGAMESAKQGRRVEVRW